MKRFIQACILLMSVSSIASPASDISEISLQELGNLQVSLVSKKKEKLTHAAAAVYVITSDDIRRSGVTSIAEALKLVPGMQVARIDANKWAVTSRGFIGRFSNKLLVLIDGRSVYINLFAGVFWDMVDILLEDVDRIEVIRGPGATLWGANAVNGIINIVTKHAAQTQGGYISSGIGTEERLFGAFRLGKKLGQDFNYRIFTKYTKRDNFVHLNGETAADGWDIYQLGLRADWDRSPNHTMSLNAAVYHGTLGHTLETVTFQPPYSEVWDYKGDMGGWYALFHSQYIFKNASVLNFQCYSDYLERDEGTVIGKFGSFDLDLNYLFDIGHYNQVICGIGYRLLSDKFENTFYMNVIPPEIRHHLFSAFVQDDIIIRRNRFKITIGSKFEHHDYTGFEYQPNFRFLWTPDRMHTVWGAVSRAVRTPAIFEREERSYYNAQIVSYDIINLPILVRLQGNREFRSETLLAHELGYRYCPTPSFLIDIALFTNHYEHLFAGLYGSLSAETNGDNTYLVMPLLTSNQIYGNMYGSEILIDKEISPHWRIQTAYSLIKGVMHLQPGAVDSNQVENIEKDNPLHQFFFRSSINLPRDIELDLNFRYMDELADMGIPDYCTLDIRLGWHPTQSLEVDIVGQNLLHDRFMEFIPEINYTQHTKVQRGVYFRLKYKFGQ